MQYGVLVQNYNLNLHVSVISLYNFCFCFVCAQCGKQMVMVLCIKQLCWNSGHILWIGEASEFVLAIQEYFGLPFSLLFSHPNIFWYASSPFWPAI